MYNGPNTTALDIISPLANDSLDIYPFGSVTMFNDPMNEGPELSSKLLERSEGFYAQAFHQGGPPIQAMNLHFTQGKYNGSIITVLRQNNYEIRLGNCL